MQRDQKFKRQLERLWPPYFEMCVEFWSFTTLWKSKPLMMNIIWCYLIVWVRNKEKKYSNAKEKKYWFTKTMHHVTIWWKMMVKLNELYFDLLFHLSYTPDLTTSDYWLFADLPKNAQLKEVKLQKWLPKLKPIFKTKANCYKKKV